jgi:hypothetical protein
MSKVIAPQCVARRSSTLQRCGMNRRPSPEQVAARKYEIAKRYARKRAKLGKRSRGLAAFRLSELTRLLDDRFGEGVELEACDTSYGLVRIVVHHLGALPDAPRRITRWCATYAPWISPRDLERLISEVIACPIKWSADKLGWKLRLSDADRSRLKIRTIGAFDCTKSQRIARRKRNQARYDAARRPRKREPVGKPWVAMGISRATYYRSRKA